MVPHVHCEDWCMHCYQMVNTPSALLGQVGFHVTDHWECGLSCFSYFAPLMFLQGPYFSTEGFLGLPKLKDKILVRTLSKYDRKSIISYKWPLVPFQVWPKRSICNARIIVFPCFFAQSTFFLLFYTIFTMLCCIVFFFSCRWFSHCCFITSVHSSKQNFCNKKIRP